MKYIAIAIGGVLGATVRWLVGVALPNHLWPSNADFGWTAYTPLSGGTYSSSGGYLVEQNLFSIPVEVFAHIHWSTFVVNVVGCLLLGLLLGEERRTERFRTWFQDFGAIGFCGGLTTMSTFAVDAVNLLRYHRPLLMAEYFFLNVVVGIFAVVLGAWLARRTSALTGPVEEQP